MSDEPEWMRRSFDHEEPVAARPAHLRAVQPGEQASMEPFPTIELDKLQAKDWEWDVPHVFPVGEVSNLEGYQGDGKSTIIAETCALPSRGEGLKGGDSPEGPTGSLIFSTEESPEKTMIKRLRACGADLRYVRCVDVMKLARERSGAPRFKFPSGCGRLGQSIQAVGRAIGVPLRKVVIDGVASTLDKGMDMNDEQDVRDYLDALKLVALEHQVAIVIVRHPSKGSTGALAFNRGSGSGAWGNHPRVSWLVGREPGTQHRDWRRVFVPLKRNAPVRDGLFFSTEWDAAHGEVRVVWGDACELEGDEVYAARDTKQQPRATDAQVEQALVELRKCDVSKIDSASKARRLLDGMGLPSDAGPRAYRKLLEERRGLFGRRGPTEKE